MEKILKFIVFGIVAIGFVFIGIYYAFIYAMGHNFVHDKPASPEYYYHAANRIYFTTRYRGDRFDALLDSFLKANPQYDLKDSADWLPYSDSCHCNCLPMTRVVYFNSAPKEAYQLTYDYDTMYAGGAGVVDIVFTFKNDKWCCVKSSIFDSVEKDRIEKRLDTSILEKLK